ncbi:MAG: type II toxin-antitoxin system YafQ family toxin [Gemmatimonadetes bacterium]|nr:type II toxin-antitoxin system YafQ family toxin [Gemmatimonadota bacterium]
MEIRRSRATRRFKKDWRRCETRGLEMRLLREIMETLIRGDELDPLRRVHALRGEFHDCTECHVGGDWLLIWRATDEEIVFVRTGTHDDLFG